MRGWLPSSTKKDEASKPNCAPISAVTSNSTTSASIAPLGLLTAPIGSIEPCMPACGSVVGCRRRRAPSPGGWAALLGRHHQLAAGDFAERQVDHQRVRGAARKDRGHRVGAEDRVPAAGRRHRGRRVGEGQADHARVGHGTQMVDQHAGMVAVGHAGKTHAELAGGCMAWPPPGRRPGRPGPGARRPAAPRSLLAGHLRPRPRRRPGRCAGAWCTAPRGSARARPAPATRPAPAPARSRRPSPAWAPAARSARSTSSVAWARLRRAIMQASSTLAAIIVDTRSLDSALTPEMCGVSSRFGQPEAGGRQRLDIEHVDRRAAEMAERSAAATAGSSRIGPREVLIRIAPGFIDAMRCASNSPRVPSTSGTCRSPRRTAGSGRAGRWP
jgi:hypothetical protein